jgi:hypothetical protein
MLITLLLLIVTEHIGMVHGGQAVLFSDKQEKASVSLFPVAAWLVAILLSILAESKAALPSSFMSQKQAAKTRKYPSQPPSQQLWRLHGNEASQARGNPTLKPSSLTRFQVGTLILRRKCQNVPHWLQIKGDR